MAILARIVIAIIVGIVVWLACGLVGPLLIDLKVSFAVTVGRWLAGHADILGLLAALAYFFFGFVSTHRFFSPYPYNR